MEKIDYNAPTIENAFYLLKDIHTVLVKWKDCESCGKRMKDLDPKFTDCRECAKKKKDNAGW